MMLRKLYWTEQSSDAYRTELELKTNREHSAAESSTGSDQRRRNMLPTRRIYKPVVEDEALTHVYAGGCQPWADAVGENWSQWM